MSECVEPKPIDQWLALDVTKNNDQNVYLMTPTEIHLGNPSIKAIHGGVVALFLERVAEIELSASGKSSTVANIVNTNVDFLRSSKMKPLFGSANIVRRGRRLAIIDVIAWQDKIDVPVAKATVSLRL